jgi:hypothetical protein
MLHFYRYRIIAGSVAGLVALALGIPFAGDAITALGGGEPERRLVCALADVSGSTKRSRPKYSAIWRALAYRQAARDGDVCLAPVAGSAAEITPVRRSLAADHPTNSSEAPLERQAKVAAVAAEFDRLLRKPPTTVGGSAILEALAVLGPSLDPPGRRRARVLGRAPELADPQAAAHRPQRGWHRARAGPSRRLAPARSARHHRRVRAARLSPRGPSVSPATIGAFWRAWADRTGAHLVYGEI